MELTAHFPGPKAGSRGTIWTVLIVGTIVAACAALSAHAFMLDGRHVPYPYNFYPYNFPRTGPANWPKWPLLALAAIHVHLLLVRAQPTWGTAFRMFVVFLILAGLREDLVRAWLMGVINSNPPTVYPILRDGIPNWILLACASVGSGVAASVMGMHKGLVGLARSSAAARIVSLEVVAASLGLDETWGRLLARLDFLDMPSR